MRRAIIFGGGGANGAFSAGGANALANGREMDWSILRGVSVGGLCAAFLAQAKRGPISQLHMAKQTHELVALWESIKGPGDIYRKRFGGALRMLLGASSLYVPTGLKRLIAENIDVKAIERSGRDVQVGCCDLVTGAYHDYGPHAPTFPDRVLASASIPGVFPPVGTLADGGVRNIVPPIGSAIRAGADEVYVMSCTPLIPDAEGLPVAFVPPAHPKDLRSAKAIVGRAISILLAEILAEDLRGAVRTNQIADLLPNRRRVPIYVLAPSADVVGGCLDFDPAQIRRLIDTGRDAARHPAEWLWPLSR